MPFGIAAAVTAAAGIGSAIIGSNAATSSATKEVNAATQASQVEQGQFNQTQANLQPFINTGQVSLANLSSLLGLPSTPGGTANPNAPLVAPFNPSNLAQTPGYQFTLGQGINAVQNSAAAQGGVNSGNTLQALTQYGQGLASTTYQQQLNDYMAQQQQLFSMFNTVGAQGQNAATAVGQVGANTANTIGSNLIGAGNASAAGGVSSSNAVTGGLNNIAQLAALYNNSGSSGTSPLGYAFNQAVGGINYAAAPDNFGNFGY